LENRERSEYTAAAAAAAAAAAESIEHNGLGFSHLLIRGYTCCFLGFDSKTQINRSAQTWYIYIYIYIYVYVYVYIERFIDGYSPCV